MSFKSPIFGHISLTRLPIKSEDLKTHTTKCCNIIEHTNVKTLVMGQVNMGLEICDAHVESSFMDEGAIKNPPHVNP